MAYLSALGLGITGIGAILVGTAEASMVMVTMAGHSPDEAGITMVFEAADSHMQALGVPANSMVVVNFMEAEGFTVEATEADMAGTDKALGFSNYI